MCLHASQLRVHHAQMCLFTAPYAQREPTVNWRHYGSTICFTICTPTMHITDKNELPPFPVELIVTSHISKFEEKLLGVPVKKTRSWRDQYKVQDSDAITGLQEELQRKMAVSNVSQSSTSSTRSHQPSPSKIQHMGHYPG